ncbi:MAG: hypothetical protein K8S54_06000 [Spirochaetia bacterium]|nr:hypothetical protein [Spirochaetia bacterium]
MRHFLLIVCLLISSQGWAEPLPEEAPTVAPQRSQKKSTMGFHEGFLGLSLLNGKSLAPAGSLISQEKEYDKAVRYRVASGGFVPILPTPQPLVFASEIIPRETVALEFEYGLSNYLGLGFFGMYSRIDISRQDILPLSTQLVRPVVEPLPVTRILYRGNVGGVSLFFHPLPTRRVDPYGGLRIGGGGFSGHAHSSLDPDPFRPSNRIRNGASALYGATLGTNIHVTDPVFLKVQVDYIRQNLKSNLFSSRSLGTYNILIGMGADLGSVP